MDKNSNEGPASQYGSLIMGMSLMHLRNECAHHNEATQLQARNDAKSPFCMRALLVLETVQEGTVLAVVQGKILGRLAI